METGSVRLQGTANELGTAGDKAKVAWWLAGKQKYLRDCW